MTGVCEHCGGAVDRRRSLVCPHDPFLSSTRQAQRDRAVQLLGKTVRFEHDDASARPLLVIAISWDGMVTLRELGGQYAAQLFRIVEPSL